jgi:prolipoprotein diacylglyceryltransferase
VPLNVIVLEFDPIVRIGETEVRLETIALAVVLAVSLLLAGLIARVTPAGPLRVSANAGERQARNPEPGEPLRADDLLLVALGALPGAIAGGRIGYVLLHADFYAAHPALVIDPASGSLELTLGVAGGILGAAYVLHLLAAPIDRWAHVAAYPLLLALGAGKLVQALGGDGQGLPTDLPWATLYSGDGPWGSLGADIASHPAQLYEGIATLLLLQFLTFAGMRGAFRRLDGSALLVGLALWALVRAVVATTWRDAPVMGPLRAEQLMALGLAAVCVLLLVVRRVRRQQGASTPRPAVAMERTTAPGGNFGSGG